MLKICETIGVEVIDSGEEKCIFLKLLYFINHESYKLLNSTITFHYCVDIMKEKMIFFKICTYYSRLATVLLVWAQKL